MPATGLGQLGLNIAGQAAGGIMGMVLGKANDERQYEQAQRLQQLQIQGQEQLTDYNMSKQLQMWHQTNYGAQVDEMNKAGINPALLYGGGGGGGTTANVTQGSVSGQGAQQNPGEAQAMAAQGLQATMGLQLMKAQEQVLKTQAEKNQAEADKTKGVDTDEASQRIAESSQRISNLQQGLDNDRNTYQLQRLQIAMQNIDNFEKQASQKDRLSYIESQAATAAQLLKSAAANAKVDQNTINERIQIIRQQATEAVLKNELTKENINLTQQQIKNLANDIQLGWENNANQHTALDIQRQLKDYNTDPTKDAIQNITHSLGHIFTIIK